MSILFSSAPLSLGSTFYARLEPIQGLEFILSISARPSTHTAPSRAERRAARRKEVQVVRWTCMRTSSPPARLPASPFPIPKFHLPATQFFLFSPDFPRRFPADANFLRLRNYFRRLFRRNYCAFRHRGLYKILCARQQQEQLLHSAKTLKSYLEIYFFRRIFKNAASLYLCKSIFLFYW